MRDEAHLWRAAADLTASLLALVILSGGQMARAVYLKTARRLTAAEVLVRRLITIRAAGLTVPAPAPRTAPVKSGKLLTKAAAQKPAPPRFSLIEPRDDITRPRTDSQPAPTPATPRPDTIPTASLKRRLNALRNAIRDPDAHAARLAKWHAAIEARAEDDTAARQTNLRYSFPAACFSTANYMQTDERLNLMAADIFAHAAQGLSP